MRYIMIGAPVDKVRTPAILTRLMADRGVESTVETRHVEPGGLAAFMAEIGCDPAVDGLLVTMPHKKAVIPHLAGLTQVAEAAGSVNAAKRTGSGALVGAQFDGVGLVAALRQAGAPLGTARVLLAGIGGAGLAIAQAILAHGCTSLDIFDINRALLEQAAARLRGMGPTPVSVLPIAPSGAYDLLINATPLGMRDDDRSPFANDLAEAAGWVADIVADPSQTQLAAIAKDAGVPLTTGRDMVRAQSLLICRWLLQPEIEQHPA